MSDEKRDSGFEDEPFEGEFDSDDQQYADLGTDEEFSADDFEEEEWSDDEFEEGADPKLMAREKKSFLNFNTVIIGLGLLVGFGMFVMQVSGGKDDNVPTEAPVATVPIDGQRDNIVFGGQRNADRDEAPETSGDRPDGGFLSGDRNLSDLPAAQPRQTLPVVVDSPPPTPAPFTHTDKPAARSERAQPVGQADNAQNRPRPQEALSDRDPLTPLPEGMGNLPSLGEQPRTASETQSLTGAPANQEKISSIFPGDLPGQQQQQRTATPSPAQTTALTASEDEVTVQLEEIAARLDELEERVGEASENARQAIDANSGNDSSASSTEIESLKKTIARLESKIAKLETPSSPSASAPPATRSTPTVRRQASAMKPKAPKWELRAAQPGRAWIASSGSNEMRMIDIGDSVEGLGRISSIAYQNGRWIIVGTEGSITQ
ncbi:MAG: hypothetical protein EOM26_12675 [Alphaproteobacteria bacterium]|nr:hypothetical protein [Alphaproteobacteria bacterium]